MAGPVVHPRVAARRGAARATRWWGKAWVRAVEEAAYAEADLARARALSRSGRIGGITTQPGGFVAAVEDDHGLWTVAGTVPVLDDAATEALVETVAAESGRVATLLGGDLPHDLVEHAEESGVELLPYGGELGSSCPCEAWVDPCVHALAVLYQLAWLVEADPFVLLQLRGLPRDELLARLHQRSDDTPADDDAERDVEAGLDAALRAARVLDLVHDPEDADAPVGHLF
ncbi:putative Zn finger protein [Nocardioides ginsengisegetis]|uniref:Putative Zn finger protein n=1 Tax=Nocardioides ginsengisegetis TaxID=661491 RepID=A0A7W3J3I6_9ACTN|nr:hypothetical protein [Nocardioides ginsengisegetis]MBA8805549.1 putative Zn finger protein [Nocardioides ginsengisegetis]